MSYQTYMGLRIVKNLKSHSKRNVTETSQLPHQPSRRHFFLDLLLICSSYFSPRHLLLSTNYLFFSIQKCLCHSFVPFFLILFLLSIQMIYSDPLYLLIPLVMSIFIFCLYARIRKYFVIKKRRIQICALEQMEGTHKRCESLLPSNGNTLNNVGVPNKLSDNSILGASSDSVTNGIVMRSPRKLSHDPPSKMESDSSQKQYSSDGMERSHQNEDDGFKEENEKQEGDERIEQKDVPGTEEIREQTSTSREIGSAATTAVVPLGYGSHQIKLGNDETSQSYSRGEELGDRRPSIVSFDLGMSGKQIGYAIPQDTRLRTSSEIEPNAIPHQNNPRDLEESRTQIKKDHHQRPKYRGAFSFQDSSHEEEEGETNKKIKVLQRKLSKKMSGTVRRIFSRVVSNPFNLTHDDSSDDFDSSDWSDSRFSFDSDDYYSDDDELDVISIDKKVAQPSQKKFPTSP